MDKKSIPLIVPLAAGAIITAITLKMTGGDPSSVRVILAAAFPEVEAKRIAEDALTEARKTSAMVAGRGWIGRVRLALYRRFKSRI